MYYANENASIFSVLFRGFSNWRTCVMAEPPAIGSRFREDYWHHGVYPFGNDHISLLKKNAFELMTFLFERWDMNMSVPWRVRIWKRLLRIYGTTCFNFAKFQRSNMDFYPFSRSFWTYRDFQSSRIFDAAAWQHLLLRSSLFLPFSMRFVGWFFYSPCQVVGLGDIRSV